MKKKKIKSDLSRKKLLREIGYILSEVDNGTFAQPSRGFGRGAMFIADELEKRLRVTGRR